MKTLSTVFWILAALLFVVMCVVVASNYRNMLDDVASGAPASVAFLAGIPFLIGIIVCVILAISFKKRIR